MRPDAGGRGRPELTDACKAIPLETEFLFTTIESSCGGTGLRPRRMAGFEGSFASGNSSGRRRGAESDVLDVGFDVGAALRRVRQVVGFPSRKADRT